LNQFGELVGQFHLMTDVLPHSVGTVRAHNEPKLQRSEAASQRNLPVLYQPLIESSVILRLIRSIKEKRFNKLTLCVALLKAIIIIMNGYGYRWVTPVMIELYGYLRDNRVPFLACHVSNKGDRR